MPFDKDVLGRWNPLASGPPTDYTHPGVLYDGTLDYDPALELP